MEEVREGEKEGNGEKSVRLPLDCYLYFSGLQVGGYPFSVALAMGLPNSEFGLRKVNFREFTSI